MEISKFDLMRLFHIGGISTEKSIQGVQVPKMKIGNWDDQNRSFRVQKKKNHFQGNRSNVK